tara:strand:- start:1078 stop:1410 length:333 start_codon:yes stop_codon:yes gene_type:complete
MTKRVRKSEDGKYHISGKSYAILKGSRAQVWHGTAYKTTGGLTKKDLKMNKNGRVVSLSKHNYEKKRDRLAEHGIKAKKGKFGPGNATAKGTKKKMSSRKRGSKKSRGKR